MRSTTDDGVGPTRRGDSNFSLIVSLFGSKSIDGRRNFQGIFGMITRTGFGPETLLGGRRVSRISLLPLQLFFFLTTLVSETPVLNLIPLGPWELSQAEME